MKTRLLSPDAAPGGSTTPTPAVPQDVASEAQNLVKLLTPLAEMAGPDGELAIIAANGALKLYGLLVPWIEQLVAGGLISADQQKAVLDHYNAIAGNIDQAFGGPAWQIQ